MDLNSAMRVGLVACVLSLLAASQATAQAFRLSFTGTVTGVVDSDSNPVDFFVGVSKGDEVTYTIAFDFGQSALADGSPIDTDDLNLDYFGGDPRTGLPGYYSTVDRSFFASLITGGANGDVRGLCTTHFAFAGGGNLPAPDGQNFTNVMNFASGLTDATANDSGIVMIGPSDDFLQIFLPGFDATPEDILVAAQTGFASETICYVAGVDSSNEVILEDLFIDFADGLTLTDKTEIANAFEPGGTGSFVGRITDPDSGLPITCATVVAFTGDTPAGAGSTNQDGDYEIPNLGFREYQLEVYAPDRERPVTRVMDLGSLANLQNYVLAIATSGAAIGGTVTDKRTGDPLASVRVDAVSLVSENILSTTFTCATGGFQSSNFVGVKGIDLLLRVSAPGYAIVEMQATVGTQGNDFSLEKSFLPGFVSGLITQTGGGGVEDASVSIQSISSTAGQVVTTDNYGFYLGSGLPPGSYSVNVSAPGFVSQTFSPIRVDVGAATVSIALEPGQTPAPVGNPGTGEGPALAGGCSGGTSSAATGGTATEMLFPLLTMALLMGARRRRPSEAIASRR